MKTDSNPSPMLEQLRQLVKQARADDLSVLPQLREFLSKRQSFWTHCGQMALNAEEAQLDLIAGGDVALRGELSARMQQLRSEHGFESASLLERLLIDRIAICTLQVYFLDVLSVAASSTGHAQSRHIAKRLAIANRRLCNAVRSLPLMRRLLPKGRKGVEDVDGSAALESSAEADA